MRIARLRIRNWQSYRGEHVLDLEAKVYAIVARMEGDAERSNWLGKSALLEAMVFALDGSHGFRTEDEFVSNGEAAGEVELTFDDGSRAHRSRARGKKTNFYFWKPGATNPAIGDEAELMIQEAVGLSPDDFRATCYFEQKKLSRFIDARPEERMRIVSAWLRLEPLERCEKDARQMGADLELDAKKAEGHLAALDDREAEIWKKDPVTKKPKWTAEAIAEALPLLEADYEKKRGEVATAEAALEKNATLLANKGAVVEYAQVVSDGKAARAEVDRRNLPVLKTEWEKASANARDAAVLSGAVGREASAARMLAKGQFDGKCPVAGIACPEQASINADFDRNRANAVAVNAKCREAETAMEAAEKAEQRARSSLQEAERLDSRLNMLREQAAKLAPLAKLARESGEPEDPAVVRTRLNYVNGELMELRLAIENLKRWDRELREIAATRAALRASAKDIEAKVGIFREAAVIFGKQGAQRRVSEGALGQIEYGANAVLRECSIQNEIKVSWSRETKGLATACDACGHPFPTSAKVKHCERCGAARGPKLENKLEIALKRKSGAADDIAGAGFQLAASRWLRESRGTSWSTALLDEPFGALDGSHRRSFSAHLAAMLSGSYGFEQAFVVAHHASILDALPGRIEILSDGEWAVPRVVA